MSPQQPPAASAAASPERRSAAALAVGTGIFLSRIAGLARQRVFAHYLGNSDAAGAFVAALRIPNLLQNLFGEGVLSASFIPVYARLLAEGKKDEAGRVAGAVLSLLALLVGTLVALGVAFSRPMIAALAPGFEGDVKELTVRLVEIMFPGIGLLVLSAWCLGVLNSHRRFFLSYVAPVLWNIAMIAALVAFGGTLMTDRLGQMRLAVLVGWATVAGAALQLLVQLPQAWRLNGGLNLSLGRASEGTRSVLRGFFPALLSRGVVQLSAYIDQILASFLGPAIVAAMGYAQLLYTLPVSLFGMSISSSELTEMSSAVGTEAEVAQAVAGRLKRGLARISFLIAPSSVAFLLLGDAVSATLFQTGKFGASDARAVWLILAGSTIGLLANTQSRLCVSAFWALKDTRTPAAIAAARVAASAALGFAVVFPLRERLGFSPTAAAAGLTAASGLVGWLEFALIRRALRRRAGPFSPETAATARHWGCALAAGAAGFAVWRALPPQHPFLSGVLSVGGYGALYLGLGLLLKVPEAADALDTVRRRLRR